MNLFVFHKYLVTAKKTNVFKTFSNRCILANDTDKLYVPSNLNEDSYEMKEFYVRHMHNQGKYIWEACSWKSFKENQSKSANRIKTFVKESLEVSML